MLLSEISNALTTPFNILQLLNGDITASNGAVLVKSEVPCTMRRRRIMKVGQGGPTEMLYAELPGGVRVYVKQNADLSVTIRITGRELYG